MILGTSQLLHCSSTALCTVKRPLAVDRVAKPISQHSQYAFTCIHYRLTDCSGVLTVTSPAALTTTGARRTATGLAPTAGLNAAVRPMKALCKTPLSSAEWKHQS